MAKTRFVRKLNKKFIMTFNGYDLYSVNAFAIRNIAKPDEEFTNFGTQDEFPGMIPKGEIWISDKSLDQEGIFFIGDALMRLKEKTKGAPEKKAFSAGVHVERFLRKKLIDARFRAGRPHKRVPSKLYHQHYLTLPDPKFPLEVWSVYGNLIRSYYKTDYTEGGHGYVYRWVPKNEIWIERDLDQRELPFIVSHEYLELRLMRDKKVDYEKAHGICSKIEFDLRKNKGIHPFLSPSGRKVRKVDLPKLCWPELFNYVLKHYLRSPKD